MFYIHKHEVSQQYGGPEEGGWWYEAGDPDNTWHTGMYRFTDEEKAYEKCRELNKRERERAEREEEYGYSSVWSYRSTHYAYRVEDTPVQLPYPSRRPHYE
jgi:hypothetical protein